MWKNKYLLINCKITIYDCLWIFRYDLFFHLMVYSPPGDGDGRHHHLLTGGLVHQELLLGIGRQSSITTEPHCKQGNENCVLGRNLTATIATRTVW